MLECVDICKTYQDGSNQLKVLDSVSIKVQQGQFVAITGSSGSGKSTLLNILGLLDYPDSGKLKFDQQEINFKDQKRINTYRNQKIGFVFQNYHLISEMNALENVMLPLIAGRYSNAIKKKFKTKALELLEQMGLSQRISHKPAKLSGGEQQRVAIARALIMEPSLLLCDEPTGHLDHETGKSIIQLIKEIQHKQKTSMVLVTHDLQFASLADEHLVLEKGKIKKNALST